MYQEITRLDCLIGRTDDLPEFAEQANTLREGFVRFALGADGHMIFAVVEKELEREAAESYIPESIGFAMAREDALALAADIASYYEQEVKE